MSEWELSRDELNSLSQEGWLEFVRKTGVFERIARFGAVNAGNYTWSSNEWPKSSNSTRVERGTSYGDRICCGDDSCDSVGGESKCIAEDFSNVDNSDVGGRNFTAERTMNSIVLKVRRIDPAIPLPKKAYSGDAGIDLCAAEDNVLFPGDIVSFCTGLAVEIPYGYEGQVRGRSGHAFKDKVTAFHLGTVDSGYRGEIRVLLYNGGDSRFFVKRGDRIAQLVVSPIPQIEIVEVTEFSTSERESNGFGSSGK